MEKLLPANIEAEQGVLGSLIIDPDAYVNVDFLAPDDFTRIAHQYIFRAITHLVKESIPADFVTLCDELERSGHLEQAGGSEYIISLINDVPTSRNAEHYGRIVERQAILRRLIGAAGKIAASAYEQSDADEAVRVAEDLIFRIGQGRKVQHHMQSHRDVLYSYLERLETGVRMTQGKGGITGIPSGLPMLDQKTGGFQKGNLIVFGARPGDGKTSLGLTIARSAIKGGYSGIFFSLEMSTPELAQRLLSTESKTDQSHLRTFCLHDHEWEDIVQGFDDLTEEQDPQTGIKRGTLWIDDSPALTVADMRSRTMRRIADSPVDFIIVDYIQRARPSTGEKYETRALAVGSIARDLKTLARDIGVPVIALAQLNREGARGIPTMEQLKESGDIEQESDVIGLLHPEREADAKERSYPVTLHLVKHRNGPIGSIPLWFTSWLTRFEEREIDKTC